MKDTRLQARAHIDNPAALNCGAGIEQGLLVSEWCETIFKGESDNLTAHYLLGLGRDAGPMHRHRG